MDRCLVMRTNDELGIQSSSTLMEVPQEQADRPPAGDGPNAVTLPLCTISQLGGCKPNLFFTTARSSLVAGSIHGV